MIDRKVVPMWEFKLADGSVFLLNNLLSFLVTVCALCYISYMVNTQIDKAKHTLVSAAVIFISLTVLTLTGIKSFWWVAPIIGLTVGFGKELWDKLNPKKKKFDWFDILADVVGISWVLLVYLISFYK